MPNGSLEKKTVMCDVIENGAFVTSMKEKYTELWTTPFASAFTNSPYTDMKVGNVEHIADSRYLVCAQNTQNSYNYNFAVCVYDISNNTYGSASLVYQSKYGGMISNVPYNQIPCKSSYARVKKLSDTTFSIVYYYSGGETVYQYTATVNNMSVTVALTRTVTSSDYTKGFVGVDNSNNLYYLSHIGSSGLGSEYGYIKKSNGKSAKLTNSSNGFNAGVFAIDDYENLFAYTYANATTSPYQTTILDNSMNTLYRYIGYPFAITYFAEPIGEKKFLVFGQSSYGSTYYLKRYDGSNVSQVWTGNMIASTSSNYYHITYNDKEAKLLIICRPATNANTATVLVFDYENNVAHSSSYNFYTDSPVYGFIQKVDSSYVIVTQDSAGIYSYVNIFSLNESKDIVWKNAGYGVSFMKNTIIRVTSILDNGLTAIVAPQLKDGSDYSTMLVSNGVVQRTDGAINGIAVQKKRYLEEVKVYV